MTRLKQLVLGSAAAALLMGGAVSKSFAVEPGTFQYLAGASIGIPGAAAPPPGIYTGFESAYGLYGGMTGTQGGVGAGAPSTHGIGLGAFIGIVPVVWSPGWNFLGATYTLAALQPFVTAFAGSGGGAPAGFVGANTNCALAAGNFCGWNQMFLNTLFQPVNLSWNLGGGWFVGASFTFQAPDGTRSLGSPNPDYWTLAPGAAISYLSPNWTLSANMVYQIYTGSAGINSAIGGTPAAVGFTNGDQFGGDLTALYKLGKWSFGPVGYWLWQTTSDRAGGAGCTPAICGNNNLLGLGGLVGYDFGPVDLQVWATDSVWSQNAAQAGWTIFTRIGFRLWAPEAARPLVAKN
jgi:hypothetical protein